MRAEPVMVALPGTMCTPAVFEPLARALAGQVVVDPYSWLTQPGPWDIPAVAVLGLVLVDTGAHMKSHGDVGVILDRVRDDWGDELRAAVLDRSFRTPLGPEVRTEFLRWAAALSQQAVYDVLASQRDLDLTGKLTTIGQPAIVVHGRHDPVRPPQQGRELAQSLPNAECRLVEAGHTPVYENSRCRCRGRTRRARTDPNPPQLTKGTR